ncbi:Heterokaryon incompatibility protein 6, OR allele [Colletotrichum sidae]|uniref:Heterokaryon incompatibility protein 6, OR allele n=1 Tax=Colletotrichum sidae TaxID=1347389 RepID=A0A4V3HYH6_9PEZI|nr:Heterokaryon incompatibility protein 6, OR allele [Colletotrichum sidae]
MSSVPTLPKPQDPDKFSYTSAGGCLPSASTHIRLLELYPWRADADESASESGGTDEDRERAAHYSSPLVCDISVTPTANPRLFKALSYTWGPPDKTHAIEIARTRLGITASLDTALRHLRRRDGPVTLWIDQICINQEDTAEKSKQVPLMEQIYSKAQQVLVWLGPAEADSDALMDCWEEVGLGARELDIESYFTKERLPLLRPLIENRNPEDKLTRRFQALIARALPKFTPLVQAVQTWDERPWFGRVWTIQEQALCRDTVFVCGSKVVDVDLFLLAGLIFDHCVGRIAQANTMSDQQHLLLAVQDRRVGPLLAIRRRQRNYAKHAGPGDSLYHILKKTFVDGRAQATLPRDRIYGLLSIAVDADRLGIVPDYVRPGCHFAFIEAARAVIQAGNVNVLSFSQFPKDVPDLPSWVPDWRSGLTASYTAIFDDADKFLTAAAGHTSVEVVPTADPKVLGIRGYAVDAIEEAGDVWTWESGHEPRRVLLQTISSFCQTHSSKTASDEVYSSPERRAEAPWRVPVGDLYWTHEGSHHRPSPSVAEQQHADCVEALTTLTGFATFSREDLNQRLAALPGQFAGQLTYSENMDKMSGKRPFATRLGYVGMAAAGARPGDVVVILLGCRIPYVLRPSGDGTAREYRFVGEAFCDSIMDGEILTRRTKETFLLV